MPRRQCDISVVRDKKCRHVAAVFNFAVGVFVAAEYLGKPSVEPPNNIGGIVAVVICDRRFQRGKQKHCKQRSGSAVPCAIASAKHRAFVEFFQPIYVAAHYA
jgi:hypothetical protein